jgi:hypothetical protein
MEATCKPEDGDDVTTYKCYKRIARILRKIGAHEDKNQEETLALFERDFDNYLAKLQERDIEDRTKRSGV